MTLGVKPRRVGAGQGSLRGFRFQCSRVNVFGFPVWAEGLQA